MERARDSMMMGTIERGVEAVCESIPQWTAQIYIIGVTNSISVIQLASLFSSLVGATYCVIGTSCWALRVVLHVKFTYKGSNRNQNASLLQSFIYSDS